MMHKKPLFSIIIPIYNVEPYLPRCLDSVLKQDFSDYELILVDDGSTDGCLNICRSYAAEYPNVCVLHKQNGGVSSARNLGLAHASGEWVWFIDSDDYIEQHSFSSLAHMIGVNTADIYIFNQLQSGAIDLKSYDSFFIEHYFKYDFKFSSTDKLYKLELIKSHALYFDTQETIGEDLLFNLQYYKHIKTIVFINENFYNYIPRCNSAMNKGFTTRLKSQIRLYDKIIALYADEILFPDVKCGLFLLHVISGLNQTQRSISIRECAKLLKACFFKYTFTPVVWKIAVKRFLINERANLFGQMRIRCFILLYRNKLFGPAVWILRFGM